MIGGTGKQDLPIKQCANPPQISMHNATMDRVEKEDVVRAILRQQLSRRGKKAQSRRSRIS